MQDKNRNSSFITDGRLIAMLFMTVIFLLGANLWFFFRYMSLKNSPINTEFVDNYPLIDSARQFYKSDDLIVNIQPLRDELSMIGKDQDVSIYFEVLNTGANIAVNKDVEFFPASLLKVPLILAVVKKIEQGDLKWSDELVLTEADKNKEFGELWKQPVGTRFTVDELVRQSIVNSDNTAYFILLNNIDPNEIVKVQKYLGISDFISANLEISAKKYAPILRALFSAAYLNVENSERILKWMSESEFNSYLLTGMPVATRFSHKIGVDDDKQTYNDAGIVYLANRPYILIVMIKNKGNSEAERIMKDISQKAYAYMSKYPQYLYD